MNNLKLENDIPKHKKKKNSSTSKSKEKSKHKHEYKDCLLITKERSMPYKAKYCTICGKIGDCCFFETVPCENGMLMTLNSKEMFEKYKDLEKFHINDIFQKYVSIGKEINKEGD